MPSINRQNNCLALQLSRYSRCDKCNAFAESTRKHPKVKQKKRQEPWLFKIKPTTKYPRLEKKRIVFEELQYKGNAFCAGTEKITTTHIPSLIYATPKQQKELTSAKILKGAQAFMIVTYDLKKGRPPGTHLNARTHLASQIPPTHLISPLPLLCLTTIIKVLISPLIQKHLHPLLGLHPILKVLIPPLMQQSHPLINFFADRTCRA